MFEWQHSNGSKLTALSTSNKTLPLQLGNVTSSVYTHVNPHCLYAHTGYHVCVCVFMRLGTWAHEESPMRQQALQEN